MTKTMTTTSTAFAFAALALILTACEREVQSVEWYKDHDAERMEVVRECKANPDKLNKTENCINAKQANRDIYNNVGKK
ncbi:MAG: EexN family lipoprotein [Azoarcus sp.]|jgi:predicted Fe-S protein YdhL (DUF1289 family)|nr:EexN family lipoprotein [Azoarcus sp.]